MAVPQDIDTFHASALPVFFLIASLAGLGGLGFILAAKGEGVDLAAVAIAAAVVLYGAFGFAQRISAAYPVVMSREGIRVYGLRGGPASDAHWLPWETITRASRVFVPFATCLVLQTGASRRRFWIPLKLVDADRFRHLVHEYAGRMHPVTRALLD